MSFVYFWLKGISQTGHFFLVGSFFLFPFNFQVQKGNWKHNLHLSKKSSMGNKQYVYSIPILREEKCTKDSHVLLPSHITTIQHCQYLYYYHPLFITYYSNISSTLCSYIKFSGPCTKYKFIVAVISPFFIWMAIFERSMKNVECPWPIMNLTHGLIYPA